MHGRWGHLAEDAIKKAIRLKTVVGSGVTYENIKDLHMRLCPDSLKGKMEPFPANKYTFPDEGLAPFEHMAWDDFIMAL